MKKTISLLLALMLIFSLTACAGKTAEEAEPVAQTEQAAPAEQPEATTEAETAEPAEAETTATPETRTIIDSEGREIEIDYDIQKVAPGVGSMSQITALLGSADKIVAARSDIRENAFFAKVFSDFNCTYDNSNIEDVFASGAQVMYTPSYDEDIAKQYAAGGVAYVQLGLNSIEEFMNTITIIGDILGEEAPERAKEFIDYFYGMLDEIQAKTDSVEKKTRVLALSFKEGSFSIGTSSNMQNSYISAVGGELFTEEWKQSDVNVEEIIEFDPEVIFCNRADYEAITTSEDLQTVSAIVNNRVHIIPYGTFGWGVNNAEAAGMAPLFYAKYLYPELFEDLDLLERTQSFYKEFYNYDLSAEEAQQILDDTLREAK